MAAATSNSIQDVYQRALNLQQAGSSEDALALYKTIVDINPNIAEVYFQVGRIFLENLRFKQAYDALGRAVSLKPKETAIWEPFIEATIGLGDKKITKLVSSELRKAKLSQPDFVRFNNALKNKRSKSKTVVSAKEKSIIDGLLDELNAGAFAKAYEGAALALRTYPKQAVLALVKGTAAQNLGNATKAGQAFREALKIDPDYPEAQNALGRFLLDSGQADEAIGNLRKAVNLAPKLASALSNLGAALTAQERFAEAESFLLRAKNAAPKDPEILFRLGRCYGAQERNSEALEIFGKAHEFGLISAPLEIERGLCHMRLNEFDKARGYFQQALKINPGYAKAEFRLASLAQTMGEFETSEVHFQRAITLDPKDPDVFWSYAASKKLHKDDPVVQSMKEVFWDKDAPSYSRIRAGFALSKVMEDSKEYDQVFTYLKPANELMATAYPFDIEQQRHLFSAIRSAFEGYDPTASGVLGYQDAAPIFVTGMPRSGTTLIEQIIASHSEVSGAGEVGIAAPTAHAALFPIGSESTHAIVPKENDLKSLGRTIAEHLNSLQPGATHVSDKSIQTYQYLPLIKAALPNCRIIVVRRDPRDNLLSIYKNLFVDGTHRYAYDLAALGAYYNEFDAMIAHWRQHFSDCFSEVSYDALIADPEEQSRALIAACGLEWQDACLKFHENKRVIKTLSVHQVRQPIYKSSVKSWERYADDLAPLFKVLK